MKKKKITYGEYTYEYCLITQDRKTISLTIFPDLEIVVKAPHDTDNEIIDAFFKKKWQWIEKQLTFFKQFHTTASPKKYVSGESFLYLGRQYKLIVRKASENRVSLQQGRLHLYTTGKVRDGKYNQVILENWYRKRTKIVFDERYQEMQKKFGYQNMPSIMIRKMKKRWGSYTKNNRIILNPLLIHASKKCIDYVITHELCHVKYQNHDKNFFTLLDRKYPGWEKAKEDLELRFIDYNDI